MNVADIDAQQVFVLNSHITTYLSASNTPRFCELKTTLIDVLVLNATRFEAYLQLLNYCPVAFSTHGSIDPCCSCMKIGSQQYDPPVHQKASETSDQHRRSNIQQQARYALTMPLTDVLAARSRRSRRIGIHSRPILKDRLAAPFEMALTPRRGPYQMACAVFISAHHHYRCRSGIRVCADEWPESGCRRWAAVRHGF